MRIHGYLAALTLAAAFPAVAQHSRSNELPDPFLLVDIADSAPQGKPRDSESSRPIIGIQAQDSDGVVKVLRVGVDTSAEAAGVRIGDVVISVNDARVESAAHFVRLTQGGAGTVYSIVLESNSRKRTVRLEKKARSDGSAPKTGALSTGSHFAIGARASAPGSLMTIERGDSPPMPSGEGRLTGKILIDGRPRAGIEVAVRVGVNRLRTGYAATDGNGQYEIRIPTGPAAIFGFNVLPWEGYNSETPANDEADWRGIKINPTAGRPVPLPDIRIVSPVQLLTPQPEETVRGGSVQFYWQDYPDAEKYVIRVMPLLLPWENPRGLRFAKTVAKPAYCCFKKPASVPAARKRYAWKVEAYDSEGRRLASSVTKKGWFTLEPAE